MASRRQESDGGCEGSDAEMIGNGRRGAGERDRDLEEDDELEGREERSSESGGGGGGGGGGFGGWRSHLLGGITQRVKSWYWGARPLVSFPRFAGGDTPVSLTLFLSFSLSRSVFYYHIFYSLFISSTFWFSVRFLSFSFSLS